MHASDRLQKAIDSTGSIACVGLDPRPALLPDSLRERHYNPEGDPRHGVASAFVEFNVAILDAVAGRCAAVKPQAACYEAYGSIGWQALEATIAAANERDIPVILDAKRADIGSTTAHYGHMAFGGAAGLGREQTTGIGADWMTVNPYLGEDGIQPVLAAAASDSTAGVFVLVKTSNPSSADVQDVDVARNGGSTVAEAVADLVADWGTKHSGEGGLSDVGAVVGATYPDHARALRERMPDTIFLVPGFGYQGGGGADACAGLRSDGRGVIVSSSRDILGAWQETGTENWATAASTALDAMNSELEAHRR